MALLKAEQEDKAQLQRQVAELEQALIAEKQKKLKEAVANAGEEGVSKEVVGEMQLLLDKLTEDLEKKMLMVNDLSEDK